MQNNQAENAIPWNPWHGCKKVAPAAKTAPYIKWISTCVQEAGAFEFYLFSSPQVHILSKIGIRDFPRSVKLYSTFGGIWGYSSR